MRVHEIQLRVDVDDFWPRGEEGESQAVVGEGDCAGLVRDREQGGLRRAGRPGDVAVREVKRGSRERGVRRREVGDVGGVVWCAEVDYA